MKASELRIGNLVKGNTGTETIRMILGHVGYKNDPSIHEIYKHLIGVEENGNQYNLAEIEPIPLTEEWLTRFGFWTVKGWDGYEGFIKYGVELESNTNVPFRNYLDNEVKHVHQLQNLYFALTGEEL